MRNALVKECLCKPFKRVTAIGADTDASIRNQWIEEELVKEKRSRAGKVKLLSLGGSESGKTTLTKQMKIIHMKGFSESDLVNYRYLIHANVALSLTQILNGIQKLNIELSGIIEEDLETFNLVNTCTSLFLLTQEIGQIMSRIWKSEASQNCFQRRNEIELMDSAKYFLDNLDRISATRYTPTYQDVLRSRTPTVGVYEVAFSYKHYDFSVVDVGGQKTERRKWIHCFDNVTSLLFVCSLAEYDMVMPDDKFTNRLQDSLSLFNYILRNSAFEKSSVLLFLNKKDIFADKIQRTPLQVCFREYEGPNTYEAGSEHILSEFVKRKPPNKPMYSHFTVATDTKNVELVFAASIDTILVKTLEKLNVM